MQPLLFRQLFPDQRDVETRALLESLALEHTDAGVSRPYTVVNFVASVDGRVAVGGRSGPLGDEGDRDMLGALRERADAVLAGTNTVIAEGYRRMLSNPAARERRRSAGRTAEPLACLISRSGRSTLARVPMLAEPEVEVVVFSPEPPDPEGVRARVHHEPLSPDADALAVAMGILRDRYEVRMLLCEGGPSLFLSMLRAGLVDELFLTVAPKLVGSSGAGSLLPDGQALPDVAALDLRTVLERESTLFLRYAIR